MVQVKISPVVKAVFALFSSLAYMGLLAIMLGVLEKRHEDNPFVFAEYPEIYDNIEFQILIIVSMLSWVVYFTIISHWAAKMKAKVPIMPLPLIELKSRILRMKSYNTPFSISEKNGKIIFRWEKESKSKKGSREKKVLKLVLVFKERNHSVIVKERTYTHRFTVSKFPILGFIARWHFFGGVSFINPHDWSTHGFIIENGMLVQKPYRYNFHIREMRNPITEIVIDAGWAWKPRMF